MELLFFRNFPGLQMLPFTYNTTVVIQVFQVSNSGFTYLKKAIKSDDSVERVAWSKRSSLHCSGLRIRLGHVTANKLVSGFARETCGGNSCSRFKGKILGDTGDLYIICHVYMIWCFHLFSYVM